MLTVASIVNFDLTSNHNVQPPLFTTL